MKVAIIGAGVLGRLTALKLISLNHDVTILEAQSFDHPHGAAAISAGMISPLSEALDSTTNVISQGFHSSEMWPNILAELKELDPDHKDVFFSQSGSIAISFPEEQECLLDLRKKLHNALPNHRADIKMLYNAEVFELEPELARFETAIFLKNEGHICNRQFLEATTRAIRQHASVVDYWALKGNGSELKKQYDWVIDCRGPGAVSANTFAEDESHHLVSARGEVIRVRTNKVAFTRPIRVIQQQSHIYVVPKPGNIYVVGATELRNSGTHAVTVRSSLDLLSTVYALHPGFADAEIIEAIAGQRAIYDNKEPQISQHDNILCANGLSRQGWLMGPSVVEQLLGRVA